MNLANQLIEQEEWYANMRRILCELPFWVPDRYRFIGVPGVTGYDFGLPEHHATFLTFPSDISADFKDTISKVTDFMNRNNKRCAWMAPATSKSILQILESQGYIKKKVMLGLAMETPALPLEESGRVEIREVSIEEAVLMDKWVGSFYGCSKQMGRYYLDRGGPEDSFRRRAFFAYDEKGAITGYAFLDCLSNDRIGALRHGGVLPNWRRKGIYQDLVSHRLNLCRELGYSHVVTHAIEGTSSSRMEKMGMHCLCRFHLYELGSNS